MEDRLYFLELIEKVVIKQIREENDQEEKNKMYNNLIKINAWKKRTINNF